MSFGIVPFSPLFNDIELFGAPRYVRRNYRHPREYVLSPFARLTHPTWSNAAPFRYRSPSPTLFDLLNFEEDSGEEWDDFFNVPSHVHHRLEEAKATKDKKTSEVATVGQKDKEAAVAPVVKHRLGHVSSSNTENGVKFDVHLPGLALEDIKLDLDTETKQLKIKVDKKTEERSEDPHGAVRTSVHRISISRVLPLSSLPNPEDIKADFVDGVLSINVKTNRLISTTSSESSSTDSAATAPTPSAPEAESSTTGKTVEASSAAMEVTTETPAPSEVSSAPSTSKTPVPEVTVEDAEH